MLNKSISQSRKVAELLDAVGPLGVLFWTWLLAHLDREGRCHGDPDVLKGMVAPRIAGITPALIRQTAAKAHKLGLCVWYEAGGDSYLHFPGFEDNQPNMRKDREPESLIPKPTSELSRFLGGTLPADCRQTAGRLTAEGKGREGKRREEKGREENSLSTCEAQADGAATDILKVFEHYRTHHPKACPKPTPKSKEWKAIKARLAEGYTTERLCKAIDGCHKTPHNLGDNERGEKYLDLELILRDSGQVERFERNDDNPPKPRASGGNGDHRIGHHPGSRPEEFVAFSGDAKDVLP
jgi:hypothetical protein